MNVSLQTHDQLPQQGPCKLFIHQIIREDAHLLFGFFDNAERELFRQLVSVSGVGPNTARMILSSLGPSEVVQAISEGDVAALKRVKGVGAKSAERIIVDLKDKIGISSPISATAGASSPGIQEEALAALVALGFDKKASNKTVAAILKEEGPALSVGEIVRKSLKQL